MEGAIDTTTKLDELLETIDIQEKGKSNTKSATTNKLSTHKKQCYYTQLLPEKIYQSLDFIESEIQHFIRGYQRVRLQQIISIIALHITKDEEKATLNMTFLRRQVPQADEYMKALIRLKIVCTDGEMIVNEKSYSYWFAPSWNSKYISVNVEDQYLIKRLQDLSKEIANEQKKSLWGHTNQIEYLSRLTIDESFFDYIENVWVGTEHQYNVRIASVTGICKKDFRAKRDNTSRRLHSNVTRMAKDVRKFLRVDGQRLANIDIKNSQPYLSSILLTDPLKLINLAKSTSLKKILKSIKVTKSKDIELYKSLVTSGRIYEHLMGEYAKAGLIFESDPIKNRDETKKQVLRILFARNKLPKNEINRQARQIFINLFPNVHAFFSKLRGRERDKFNAFNRLAILLQTIESHLVLDVIMKRIYKELPGVFAVTIHDSILTVDDQQVINFIENVMAEELEKFTGFRPILKIER